MHGCIQRWLVCLTSWVLLTSSTARAQTANDLYRQSVAQYGKADFEASITLLQRARKLTTAANVQGKIHLLLGVNQSVLGQSELARQSFKEALNYDPTVSIDAEHYRSDTVALFREVRRGLRGTLAIISPAPGAAVTLDGLARGSTPLEVSLPAGEHSLVVQRGDKRYETKVIVVPGQKVTITARYDGDTAPDGPDEAELTKPLAAPRPAPKHRWLWTYVAGGAALVSAGVGVGFGLAASSKFSDYESANKDPADTDLDEQTMDRARVANVLYGVASGLAAVTVALFIIEGWVLGGEKQAVAAAPGGLLLRF